MMRRTIHGLAAAVLISALCLTGCGESKEAKAARLQGIEQMNAGSYAEAIASFDTALKEADGVVNKFELDILKYRGEAEYNLGDYAAASHTYEILLDVDKRGPEYLYYKAAADALSGSVDTAVEEYNVAAEEDRKMNRNVAGSDVAIMAIGKALTDGGDYEKAMSFYQSAAENKGAFAELYNQMGLCMIEAGKYEEAAGYFEQGIALGEEEVTKELIYNKGAAYEYQGDFAKALEILNGYVSAYGSTPELEKEITFLQSR